jgi:glutathione peroxidase-family protein
MLVPLIPARLIRALDFCLCNRDTLMRTFSALFLNLILALGCMAQDKSKITPTPDPNAPFKVYIPKDLEDAFSELKKMLSPALLNEIRLKSEKDVIEYHHGFGTWLRNNWGLWAGSRLAQYFRQLGINHPDDMSGIILTSFWRYLHSQPIKLEEQVEYYKEYWRKAEEREVAITPVSESAMNSSLKAFSGETLRLTDYKGKVVLLAWMDESCGLVDKGCQMASSLVKLKNEYSAQGVEVIGLVGTYPSNPAKESRKLRGFVRKYRINFPLVWSDDDFSYDVSSYDEFGYMSFPQIFVISRDGRVVKRLRGFNPEKDPALLRETIEQALRQG